MQAEGVCPQKQSLQLTAYKILNSATLTSRGTIGSKESPLSDNTINEYLDALGRLMTTEDLPAWNTHIRSGARLRKTPKRHFVDLSIATAVLGLDSERLLVNLEYMGFLFESMVIRDLRVYAQRLGGKPLDVLGY